MRPAPRTTSRYATCPPARRAAAEEIAATGFPLRCVTIGPSQDYEDPFGDWARASEIEDDGVLLVRPDQFVAWRQRTRVADCAGALRSVIARIAGGASQA